MRHMPGWATAAALALFLAATASAQPAPNPSRVQTEARMQQRIYGSQIMTQQERIEYHIRMRKARSQQEQERIRAEHHRSMQERAQARGLTLPEVPGSGMGSMGPGMGGDMGGGRR